MQWFRDWTCLLEGRYVALGFDLPHMIAKAGAHICEKSAWQNGLSTAELTWKIATKQNEAEGHSTNDHICIH